MEADAGVEVPKIKVSKFRVIISQGGAQGTVYSKANVVFSGWETLRRLIRDTTASDIDFAIDDVKYKDDDLQIQLTPASFLDWSDISPLKELTVLVDCATSFPAPSCFLLIFNA